jgi:hypothetical protein
LQPSRSFDHTQPQKRMELCGILSQNLPHLPDLSVKSFPLG